MTKETLVEVVETLCGSCFPYGDHYIDKDRMESLELKTSVVVALLKDIADASKLRNRCEQSIKEIAEKAYVFLVETKDWVDENLGEEE